MAGMEHWLPLFEERCRRCSTISARRPVVRDAGADKALREPARGDRAIITRTACGRWQAEPGSYRPLEPEALYLAARRMGRARRRAADPPRLAFPEPESERIIDFGVEPARDFAPERAQQANVYEAVAEHVEALRRKRPQGRAGQLHARRARAPRRPARGSWPQGAEAGRQLAGSARLARPSRRCSSFRSTMASPRPTSPSSPSRTCSATGSFAVARSARPPPPSSKNWQRSRRATSSSTPTMASAATRG